MTHTDINITGAIDLEAFVDRIAGVYAPDRAWSRARIRGVLEELVRVVLERIANTIRDSYPATPAHVELPVGLALPTRTRAELAFALRTRAARLSGAAWEVPATAAMMCEAAKRLEDPV